MSSYGEWVTCRVCHKRDRESTMLRYGIRHLAHFRCFLEKKGKSGFLALPEHRQGKFPGFLLKEFGLLPEKEVKP